MSCAHSVRSARGANQENRTQSAIRKVIRPFPISPFYSRLFQDFTQEFRPDIAAVWIWNGEREGSFLHKFMLSSDERPSEAESAQMLN